MKGTGVMETLKALVADLDKYGDTFPDDTRALIKTARIVTKRHTINCECGVCPPRS